MNIFILFGTFVTFVYILLLAAKPGKRISDLFLGLIFLSYGLNIGLTWGELFNIRNGFPYPWCLNISWLFLLLHGPVLWCYIKSFTTPNFRFRPIYLLHFMPFLVMGVAHYIDFLSLPAVEKTEIVAGESFKDSLIYKISVLSIAISTIGYNLWGLKLIREHQLELKRHFSRIDDKDLKWLEILIITNLCIYGVNATMFNLDLVFHIASYTTLMTLAYTFATIYTIVLGYFAIRQENVLLSARIADAPQANTRTSSSTGPELLSPRGNAGEELINRILVEMEQKQPYLDPELTLAKLSKILHVRPAALSEILNSQVKKSFFDFVNQYRVEDFKTKSLSGTFSHLSIMGVAYECGFNSKAAFYRAFRKYENCSPSDFLSRENRK